MISESTINKVRNLAIEDVLRPYVKLSRKGSTLMGLCPFHPERTGSFAVTPGKNLFHCFSCNRGGDGIAFIMEKENLTFMEAVAFIAKNNGIPVEYSDEERSEEELAEVRHKESLLVILDHLQRFFVENLRVAMTDESRGQPVNTPTADGRKSSVPSRESVMPPRMATHSWSIAGQRDSTRNPFLSLECSSATRMEAYMPCSGNAS